jgi:hypothetical protein
LVSCSIPPMTGSPGIPPGCGVVKCWTDWDRTDIAARKITAKVETDRGVAPRKAFWQRWNRRPRVELGCRIFCVKVIADCGLRLNIRCRILFKNCPNYEFRCFRSGFVRRLLNLLTLLEGNDITNCPGILDQRQENAA